MQMGGAEYSVLSVSASETVQVTFKNAPSAFNDWQAAHFNVNQLSDLAISAFNADSNGSGIPNGLKFFFDIDPTGPNPSDSDALPRPGVEWAGGLQFLTLTYRSNPQAAGMRVDIQISNDLGSNSWETILPDYTQSLAPDPVTGDPRTKVMVNVTGQNQKFIRLSITAQ